MSWCSLLGMTIYFISQQPHNVIARRFAKQTDVAISNLPPSSYKGFSIRNRRLAE